jgi:hypothetical protein
MPGAGDQTRPVINLKANWRPGAGGDDGRFELLPITEGDQRFITAVSPAALTALVAIARPDTVLAWDPTNATLIAANLIGQMPWTLDPDRR